MFEIGVGLIGILFFVLWFFMFFVVGIGGTIFWIWMLFDCLQNPTKKDDDRLVWILVLVFTHVVGARMYYFMVRKNRL